MVQRDGNIDLGGRSNEIVEGIGIGHWSLPGFRCFSSWRTRTAVTSFRRGWDPGTERRNMDPVSRPAPGFPT